MSNLENQNTKKKKTVWRLIAKALGEKSSKCDKEADKIALIRLLMFLSIFITNCFIVANAIRHWNDETVINVEIVVSEEDVSSYLSQTQKERILKANSNFAYD
jgi:hypothetical protein